MAAAATGTDPTSSWIGGEGGRGVGVMKSVVVVVVVIVMVVVGTVVVIVVIVVVVVVIVVIVVDGEGMKREVLLGVSGCGWRRGRRRGVPCDSRTFTPHHDAT